MRRDKLRIERSHGKGNVEELKEKRLDNNKDKLGIVTKSNQFIIQNIKKQKKKRGRRLAREMIGC